MSVGGYVDAVIDGALHALTLDDLSGAVFAMERGLSASGSLLFDWDDAGRMRPIAGSLLTGMSAYTEEHLRSDPIHPYLRRRRPSFIVIPSDFPRRAFERCAAYPDFYRPHEAEQLIGIWPDERRYGEPGMVGIVLTRSRRQPRFSRDELRPLHAARSALRAAVDRARRLEATHARLEVAEALLAAGASAVDLVWNPDGRLLWTSAEAQALSEGRIAALTARARVCGRALGRTRQAEVLGKPIAVTPSLVASFFVVSAVADGPWLCATLSAAGAQGALAPSPAELRVLRLLSRGCSNPQIAARLGLSIETVRTHVKQLLRKLDAENRTAAALRARELGLLEG